MRTKQEVIKSYLGNDNPEHIEVKMSSECVKDVMNLWGEELLEAIVLEIGNVNRKQITDYLTDTADIEMLDIVKIIRQKMYPSATFG